MISALGQYNLYKTYSAEAMNRIQKVDVETVQNSEKKPDGVSPVDSQKAAAADEGSFRRKDVSFEDATVGLKQSGSVDAIGRDSSIENLDLTKVISDLKKDETLQQYQYFVGGTAQIMGSEDGIVLQKSGL